MAKPTLKRGVWYGRIKDHAGKWTRPRLGPLRSKEEPYGLSERRAVEENAEMQAKENRIRRGLEPAPVTNIDPTFAALITWWITRRLAGTPSYDAKAPTLIKHIVNWVPPADPDRPDSADLALGPLRPADVTAGRLTDFLKYKVDSGELAAGTANGIRASIRAAINAATQAGRFHGANPVTKVGVKPTPEPKRVPRYLESHWIALILDNVPDHHRGIFATGIYLGLRKGEIFALEKTDIELDREGGPMLTVRRSHDRLIPKGNHEEPLPIPTELVPILRQAIAVSPSEIVFPRADGTRHLRKTDLVGILRSCLKRIGFGIIGYRMKCRRRAAAPSAPLPGESAYAAQRRRRQERCGYMSDLTKDGTVRPCPNCGFSLWPAAEVEPYRFHDTRHTTASLLTMFGANPKAVQKLMRHRNLATTDIYSHMAPGFLRSEAELLSFRPAETGAAAEPVDEDAVQAVQAATTGGNAFGTPLVPVPPKGPPSPGPHLLQAVFESTLRVEREKGLEPSTSTLARGREHVAGGAPSAQLATNTPLPSPVGVQSVQPTPVSRSEFGTPLVPGLGVRVLRGGRAPRLLTTREVAAELGVSPSTVYKLCESGALPSVRIIGAIRVAPADLAAYVTAQKNAGRRG
jgi:integrase